VGTEAAARIIDTSRFSGQIAPAGMTARRLYWEGQPVVEWHWEEQQEQQQMVVVLLLIFGRKESSDGDG
jgi:hypothetical protein